MNVLHYESFLEYPYTMLEMMQNYSKALRSIDTTSNPSGSYTGHLIAGKLTEYHSQYLETIRVLSSMGYNILKTGVIDPFAAIGDAQMTKPLDESEKNFYRTLSKCYNGICTSLSNSSLSFSVDGRLKSFISFVAKIIEMIDRKKILGNLRDTLAFRFIVDDNHFDSLQSIKCCYQVLAVVNRLFIENNFIQCESRISNDGTVFNNSLYPDVFVPHKKSLKKILNSLSRTTLSYKDYIISPKSNGYQGLHVSYQDSVTQRCIEIQIRTKMMHDHAENLNGASHHMYKQQKYGEFLNVDLSKIRLKGFEYLGNGKYIDRVGLLDPIKLPTLRF